MTASYKESQNEIEVKNHKKYTKIAFGVVFVLCFLGTVVGIPIAVTYANGGKKSTPEIPEEGWKSWSSYGAKCYFLNQSYV